MTESVENWIDSELRTVISEACRTVRLQRLTSFNTKIENISIKSDDIVSFLKSFNCYEILSNLIEFGVVQEQKDTEICKENFKSIAPKSEQVLKLLLIFIHHVNEFSNDIKDALTANVKKVSPNILYFVSGNIPENSWTSPKTRADSNQLLTELKRVYKVETLSELFGISLNDEREEIASQPTTLFGIYHANLVKHKLNKEKWQRNPFAKASFVWILLHMKFPHMSDYLELVLSFPLNMVDNFQVENKILGTKCLHHIMENISHEQLRWYGRAEVVYEAVKHQLYTKDAVLVAVVHPALLTVLSIVENTNQCGRNMTRNDEVFQQIVHDSEMENNLALRRALTAKIPAFIHMLGITVVRHMKAVIRLVSNFLEIYDGPEEVARIHALEILKTLLVTAWPRIPSHASQLMKCLLKFLYDVRTDTTLTPETVKITLIERATECLFLLKKAAPNTVVPAIVAILNTESKATELVRDILSNVNAL